MFGNLKAKSIEKLYVMNIIYHTFQYIYNIYICLYIYMSIYIYLIHICSIRHIFIHTSDIIYECLDKVKVSYKEQTVGSPAVARCLSLPRVVKVQMERWEGERGNCLAVTKTLVICCIEGIIQPSHMGIVIGHFKNPY